jgi:site-specific DNA recombinase
MKRAAIYARFSTDLQNERSIEDQIAVCRELARRENLIVVTTFEDRARSGASIFNRDGLLALMEQSQAGAFDVLIVEALDRLSRDMEDLAGIHKRLTFRDIEIRAVHDGVADTVTIGLRGLVGQLYREDGAKKVRRGMAAVIRDARHAGGRAYGYRPVRGERGKLAIVDAEATIVRRIFAEWNTGRTARDIAHDLNHDRAPPPRGQRWNASTIYGNATRHNGIIRNPLYAGTLVWNRLRMVKDPDTGRRVSRLNPRTDWQTTAVPDLAIVDDATFDAAQARLAERAGVAPERQRRPRHLLSGLLRCASCGSGMSTFGADRSGRKRLRCTRTYESGDCLDPQTFYLETVERTVLEALRAELSDPRVITEYVRTYQEERARLAGQQRRGRAAQERRAGELRREINRLVDHLAKGIGIPEEIGARMKEAHAEERAIKATLVEAPSPVIALHPGTLARYEAQLADLQKALAAARDHGNEDIMRRLGGALRDLVQTVMIRRDPTRKGGIELTITGRLNALLGEKAFPHGCVRNGGSGGRI